MLGPGEHIVAEVTSMIECPIHAIGDEGIGRTTLSGRQQFQPHLVVGIVINLKPGSEIFIAGEENGAAGDDKQER